MTGVTIIIKLLVRRTDVQNRGNWYMPETEQVAGSLPHIVLNISSTNIRIFLLVSVYKQILTRLKADMNIHEWRAKG